MFILNYIHGYFSYLAKKIHRIPYIKKGDPFIFFWGLRFFITIIATILKPNTG